MKENLRSMCLARTQFEQEIGLRRKTMIEKINCELKNYEFSEASKITEKKDICDLRQKINEMGQKNMIRKPDLIKKNWCRY